MSLGHDDDDGISIESDRVVIDLAKDDDFHDDFKMSISRTPNNNNDLVPPPMIQIGVGGNNSSSSSSRSSTTTSSSATTSRVIRHYQKDYNYYKDCSSKMDVDEIMNDSEGSNRQRTHHNNRPIKRPCHQRTTTAPPQQQQQQQQQSLQPTTTPKTFPLLLMEDDINENVEMTADLLGLMNICFFDNNVPNVESRSCCSSNSNTTHFPLLHIHQRDEWSCGFRNLQMLLCGLLLTIPSTITHPYFIHHTANNTNNNTNNNDQIRTIPSLHTIQYWLEQAWVEGFDERGKNDYGGNITLRKQWIGAVEAVSVLWYLHIDAIAIQFITCTSSRQLLAPFVWNYFSTRNCDCCNQKSCTDYARYLLVLAKTGEEPTTNIGCQCPTPPLYLQWKGHSVTIVGIQRRKQRKNDDHYQYDLILFDPARSGERIKEDLTLSLLSDQNNDDCSMNHVAAAVDNSKKQQRSGFQYIKKSCFDLLQRDCQIILSTDRVGLSNDEREKFKRTYVVTASEADVRERMGCNNRKKKKKSSSSKSSSHRHHYRAKSSSGGGRQQQQQRRHRHDQVPTNIL